MVDALIQAGKFFDLLPMPEQRHGIAGTSAKYREALIRRYFQEHLKPELGRKKVQASRSQFGNITAVIGTRQAPTSDNGTYVLKIRPN
jgi:hypothetical protein